MADEREDDEWPGEFGEALGPPVDCGVILSGKMLWHRITINLGDDPNYPPGTYISARAIMTATLGDLKSLRWALLPVGFMALESSYEWKDVQEQWREQYQQYAQRIDQVVRSALRGMVETPALDYVEFDFDRFDGTEPGELKIKSGPKKKTSAMSALNKRRWERFQAALSEYTERWNKARDCEDIIEWESIRNSLPLDLVKEIDKRLPNRRHKYKPYQVALVHLARVFKVLGVGSEYIRVSNWKTVDRAFDKYKSQSGDK